MKKGIAVVDLSFGDSGKGTTVDALVRHHKAGLVVRFNGGPQAAHNVVLPDGTHHTFSQFGSGTLAGARTYLSREVWVDPVFLEDEAERLQTIGVSNPLSLVAIHQGCGIVTPFHQAMGKLRELCRGWLSGQRNGSCGFGVGEAVATREYGGEALTAGDVTGALAGASTVRLLRQIQAEKAIEWRSLRTMFDVDCPSVLGDEGRKALRIIEDPEVPGRAAEIYRRVFGQVRVDDHSYLDGHDIVIFEGAQGILIDQHRGCRPHCTWSDCTSLAARRMIETFGAEREVIGVMRTHMVRHGAGPMFTEDDPKRFYGAMGIEPPAFEGHNPENAWQGNTRYGHLDLPALRYAIAADEIDGLAITHEDQLRRIMPVCTDYLTDDGTARVLRGDWFVGRHPRPHYATIEGSIACIGDALGRPVRIVSSGPTWADKTFL